MGNRDIFRHAFKRRSQNSFCLALAIATYLFASSLNPRQLIAEANTSPEEKKETSSDEATPSGNAGKLYVDGYLVWVYAKPERTVNPIGSLRAGQAVSALHLNEKGQPRISTRVGCKGGWYAIKPAGYICKNRFISLTPTRYFNSMKRLLPRQGPYPFDYALSMGAPAFRRIPSTLEKEQMTRIYGKAKVRPLPRHWRGHEELVHHLPLGNSGRAHLPDGGLFLGEIPEYFQNSGSVSRRHETRLKRRDVPFGSMLAVNAAFKTGSSILLQSTDGTLVPRERFRLFRRSTFQGVSLGKTLSLPIAWPKKTLQRFSLSEVARESLNHFGRTEACAGCLVKQRLHIAEEELVPLSRTVPQRTPLALTGRRIQVGTIEYLELKEGNWLPRPQLYLVEAKRPPRHIAEQKNKWIHFSIARGTLTAYQGKDALFTTLASPGIGGLPKKNKTPLESRTTPVGIFRIHYKYYSDDMSPEAGEHRKFWIADVPFTQYFKQPFAIHVAYWHESFGEPMSGGCINVSPKDGQSLFNFTEPHLPPDWYGVSASKAFGKGTTVVITTYD